MTATVEGSGAVTPGRDPARLAEPVLLRELHHLHRTRLETLRHGSRQALAWHTRRMNELEAEYLRRHPRREVEPGRLRSGARARR